MKFENEPRPAAEENDARLTEDEAHEEANILQASMEKDGKGATAEDYDKAMEDLEELKRLADEGPEGMDKAKQYLTRIMLGATAPMILLGHVIDEMTSFHGKGTMVGRAKDQIDGMLSYFTKNGVAWTDAQRRLEALKWDAARKEEEEAGEKE